VRNCPANLFVETFLRQIPGLQQSNIATRIPRDDKGKVDLSAWGDRLVFITGIALPGGTEDLGTEDGVVPVQIECWARPETTSNKVPWERAAAASEIIKSAAKSQAYDELEIPRPYRNVFLDGIEMETPYEVADDPLRFARYTFTMYFYYAAGD
jgi:hypothetical protein